MENQTNNQQKSKGLLHYIKKYSYYFALGGIIFVLCLAVIITSAITANEQETEQTSGAVISFDMPVMNATIIKGFSDTELQYNKVLNVWEVHKGLDFYAEVGTNVLAAYDGVVKDIQTNLLDGTVVTIDHGNGLETTYGGLSAQVEVSVGSSVAKGDIIGTASNTATSETSADGQVHFEVWKDGNLINPASYLDISTDK